MSDRITRRDITDAQRLRNLEDAMVTSILEATDEEIAAELLEDGRDPKAVANEVRAIFEKDVREARGRQGDA